MGGGGGSGTWAGGGDGGGGWGGGEEGRGYFRPLAHEKCAASSEMDGPAVEINVERGQTVNRGHCYGIPSSPPGSSGLAGTLSFGSGKFLCLCTCRLVCLSPVSSCLSSQ